VWTYTDPKDGFPVIIYDHTGTEIEQVPASAGGFTVPDAVLQVMEEEVMAEGLSGGLSERQLAILRDAVFANIEKGTPP